MISLYGQPGRVECPECKGTSAAEPDCWACEGNRNLTYREARAKGFGPLELAAVFDGVDDPSDPLGSAFFICPICDGHLCDVCEGDGTVDGGFMSRAIDRVLLTAAAPFNEIYPDIFESRGKLYRDDDALLSMAAQRICHDRGWTFLSRSVLADCLSLRPAGERALAQYFDDGTQRYLTRSLW